MKCGVRRPRQRHRPPSHHALDVIPREGGESSTPRLLGSSRAVSGILGRPVKPGDDSGARSPPGCRPRPRGRSGSGNSPWRRWRSG
ncbi:hypothetical protein C7U89_07335 [Bradyrhizobium sp. WBOS4]|nr:hypothetical protein [Bradyrhizobium sp. WBOS8]MDD1582764.1 hypothetical protein [Bradyrhizobium sp. WBOS4]UUO48371.1 hypothetical protein DCM78_16515 [Bradyrhizobium sp. WBOS04]UUO61992.1 hypothetical protein DCM80_24255 [Bradyrhizobium sp. WBOS08]